MDLTFCSLPIPVVNRELHVMLLFLVDHENKQVLGAVRRFNNASSQHLVDCPVSSHLMRQRKSMGAHFDGACQASPL